MKKFARTISYLPFCGKVSIRPFVFGLYRATTHSERTAKFWPALILLVLFIFFHGIQAKMGFTALHFDAPVWVRIIFGLYAIANTCVVLTQAYLLYRITVFLFAAPLPRIKRNTPEFSGSEVLWMTGVTFGGQILFSAFYLAYQ